MNAITAILQNKIARWIGAGVLILGAFGFLMVRYQEIKKERESIAAKLKEAELAYTHQAEQVKKLEQTVTQLKKRIYTLTVIKPDGTTIITTSEYVDSTTNSNSNTSTTTTPVFRPSEVSRYPFMLYGCVTNSGWGAGPGWEVSRVNLPLLPYTYVSVGGIIGQTWEKKISYGGVLSFQWQKK
jgi:hypothetical protein